MAHRSFQCQPYSATITFRHIAGDILKQPANQNSSFCIVYKRGRKPANAGQTPTVAPANGQATWDHAVHLKVTTTHSTSTGDREPKILRMALMRASGVGRRHMSCGEILIDIGKYLADTTRAGPKEYFFPIPYDDGVSGGGSVKLFLRIAARQIGDSLDRDDLSDAATTVCGSEDGDATLNTMDDMTFVDPNVNGSSAANGGPRMRDDASYSTMSESVSPAPVHHRRGGATNNNNTTTNNNNNNNRQTNRNAATFSDVFSEASESTNGRGVGQNMNNTNTFNNTAYRSMDEDEDLGNKLTKLLQQRDAERSKRERLEGELSGNANVNVAVNGNDVAALRDELRQLRDQFRREEARTDAERRKAAELDQANRELRALCESSRRLLAREKMRTRMTPQQRAAERSSPAADGAVVCGSGCVIS
eukprot:PhM_4_TR7586/c1_g1_i1/m.68667